MPKLEHVEVRWDSEYLRDEIVPYIFFQALYTVVEQLKSLVIENTVFHIPHKGVFYDKIHWDYNCSHVCIYLKMIIINQLIDKLMNDW